MNNCNNLRLVSLMLLFLTASVNSQILLKPDLYTRPSDLDSSRTEKVAADSILLRISNAVANEGTGKLFLYGLPANPGDTVQHVMQRIFYSIGSYVDVPSGTFIFHEGHNHIHFEDWAIFRLRAIDYISDPDSGLGAIVKEGEKTSYCIIDVAIYDSTLPGFSYNQEFTSCYIDTQGISVGWLDLYNYNIPGQWINVWNVPDGLYWLESETDPDDNIVESNNSNNISRTKVRVIKPDSYEQNNSIQQVDPMFPGGVNSSNFGPCDNNPRVIWTLNVHKDYWNDGDVDFFKFRMWNTGQSSNFVEIIYEDSIGNLDLYLLNSSGVVIDSSVNTTFDDDDIRLTGRPAGWYYIKVVPKPALAQNPNYVLVVYAPSDEVCGDVNADGSVTVADVIALNNYLNGGNITCFQNADVNRDCQVNSADRTYLINYIYYHGPAPQCDCL